MLHLGKLDALVLAMLPGPNWESHCHLHITVSYPVAALCGSACRAAAAAGCSGSHVS